MIEKRVMTEEEVEEIYGATFNKLVEAARTNYLAFYSLFALRPDKPKLVDNFQDACCNLVQDVLEQTNGKGRRQTTSAPPQHGKTDVLVRGSIPWAMGRWPRYQVGLAAYDYSLVEEISSEAKGYIEHPWYQRVFPGTKLDNRINRIVNWGTNKGARLRAVSGGRKLTGRRVDLFIGDDLYPGREEVESSLLRAKVRRWYDADCYSRLSPDGIVWLVGTRWHPEDLAGWVNSEEFRKPIILAGAEHELFQHTNFPAICEDPEIDPLGREEGQALCPELKRDEAFLNGVKATTESYEWNSQYQGRPQAAGGGQVDLERLNYIDYPELPKEGLIWARGWDLATEIKKHNDFSAGVLCAWHNESKSFYIVDSFKKKLPWPKLKKKMVELAEYDRYERDQSVLRLGVEGVSGFTIGFHEIREALRGKVRVQRKNPPKGIDKLERALPWLNWIEAGKVYIVNGSWNKDFTDELMSFPTGAHDDQIDGVSIAREMLTRKAIPRHA